MAGFGRKKSFKDLSRKSKGFAELRRILIVCEGAKTEPNYFRGLLKKLALRAASVIVVGEECGSAPISVYQYAAKRYSDDGGFDEVYCVFDRDKHHSFDEAISAIANHPSKVFRSVASHPSFEYWLLLHFRYTRAPFVRQGSASAGDVVLRTLKTDWPAYTKGIDQAFHVLDSDGKTEVAISNARLARVDAERTGEINPSTEVDKLVAHVIKLAEDQLQPAVRKKP